MRNNIAAVRMELDLSMRELSRKSGVSVSSISLIESGEVSPTVPVALAICKALGRDIYEIFPDAKP
jgi:DNA-binding XRE family transcriptional regulator